MNTSCLVKSISCLIFLFCFCDSIKRKMADIKSLEHPTLKVPYEILNKEFRKTQKNIDREISHINTASSEINKFCSGENVKARDVGSLLGGMVEKLQVLKRKAEEGIAEELSTSNTCKKRLDHLKEQAEAVTNPNVSQGMLNQWRRKRLDRMVVEYFLRNGYYNAAIKLAERSGVKDLTNIDIFLTSREVEKSLARKETAKCLAWCHDNKSKLRRLKSNMEFNIRIQEFVELVRADKRMDAVKHSRKYFPIFQDEHLDKIKEVMGLLAFPNNTPHYKALLDANRWDTLIEEFRQENYRLFQLASQSVFTVALEAGLSALKTPQCYSEDEARNPACPVCQEDMNKLAEPLPFAHCSQSRLYCHISGLPLNENNQPMMLPNGCVYGEQALAQMARENNGQIICPKTKEVFPFKKVDKVFVM
ncbi:E3 ubiquitin-protein transferase MAEA isoform X2 [Coccinella septempunctata]|uniref:E3 ubiquitin-protein transferase MAEA isoform X2 n=1 Tax=Coccinella septempunctata TaxID=41139 RepID=UPI001D08D313|nr:E3 ubiquitin-protein transferase MAEA isoform X2 [Coccinella septempunctata]